jgi:transcriptional regulator with XRE-family HTH domain
VISSVFPSHVQPSYGVFVKERLCAVAALPGYELRVARERAGLSQAELAERLGVSQQAVGRAERVDSNPTVALMDRWARGCGCRFELSFADESSG